MSRDRLAEKRAQNQKQDSYELTSRRLAKDPFTQQDDTSGDENYTSLANLNMQSSFLGEVDRVQKEIGLYVTLINQIEGYHQMSESAVEDNAAEIASLLEERIQDATASSDMIKRRITALKNWNGPERNPQLVALTSHKFLEAIQSYQEMESKYRSKYKQRMERQARIVQPGATEEEIQAMVVADQPIFAQELKNSNRIGEATSAYREARARHEDVVKIESTIYDLGQLFNDMSLLIQEQDEQIDAIKTNVAGAEGDLEAGLHETTVAVKHARNARGLRKWCFGITVVIIIIIVIIVLVTVLPKLNKS